jgi:N6-L-threonylcarbamoyladenine synthase
MKGWRAVRILGIESSCDETAAAVVESGRRVLSNVIASQHDLHAEYGGVVPELASRAHAERVLPVVKAAVERAGIGPGEVDAVAVGHRPGLIGSLLVGVAAAKALAWSLGKPLVGVDHIHAHLYAGFLGAGRAERGDAGGEGLECGELAGAFPALGLVVSGGHTAMYHLESPVELSRLGSTIDDAMGEAFDKAATILGLPYPGGPNLDALAGMPGADERAVELPVSRLGPGSLDFSFSGLKTSLLYAVRGKPLPGGAFERDHGWLSEGSRADSAASFQRAAVRAITIKLERAIGRAPGGYRSLLAGGGVTANSRLRRELGELAAANGLRLVLPPLDLCVDNAAMVAGLGFHLLRAGRGAGLELQAVPTASV